MTNTEIQKVSNSDVVRIKGRARVMSNAWFAFKDMGVRPFAKALKGAWEALRASVALDIKSAAVTAQIKAETIAAKAKAADTTAKRKAEYIGSKNSRSPLNPFRSSNVEHITGKWSNAYCATVGGR